MYHDRHAPSWTSYPLFIPGGDYLVVSPMTHAVIAHVILTGTPDNGTTQKEIAEALRCSQSTVSKIISRTPGFASSKRPLDARGYWFDTRLVTEVTKRGPKSKSDSSISQTNASQSVTNLTGFDPRQVEPVYATMKDWSEEKLRSELPKYATALTALSDTDAKRLAAPAFAYHLTAISLLLTERLTKGDGSN